MVGLRSGSPTLRGVGGCDVGWPFMLLDSGVAGKAGVVGVLELVFVESEGTASQETRLTGLDVLKQ